MENRRATGPDQNVVNLACAECCAWADQVETLRKNLHDTDVLCDFYKKEGDFRRSERDSARAEIGRINAECNAWSNRAKIAEADLDLTRRNMQREINDLERENASLRRRLREGGR